MQRVSAAFRAKRMPLVGKVSVEELGKLLDYVMMSYILEVRMKCMNSCEMQIWRFPERLGDPQEKPWFEK